MICMTCGEADLETEALYRCPGCGEDYAGRVGSLVLDAHSASLRAENAKKPTEVRRGA